MTDKGTRRVFPVANGELRAATDGPLPRLLRLSEFEQEQEHNDNEEEK